MTCVAREVSEMRISTTWDVDGVTWFGKLSFNKDGFPNLTIYSEILKDGTRDMYRIEVKSQKRRTIISSFDPTSKKQNIIQEIMMHMMDRNFQVKWRL